jgi:predicted ATPase
LGDLISRRQSAGVNQERIFEEYTDVLTEISRTSPLLLILDDLHWADTSSINLLFHLGQRLTKTPILILCAYRPEDVYVGRQGQAHPLVSVLNEFKRLFGDSGLNLDQGSREDGRQFVDALLDTEPNRLSHDFREQLTRNTRGHPLFTVEILREMQERGDVTHDEAGRWIENPTITWDSLPRRVEGVIEKRVNCLAPQLKDVLVTASVEGEEFTSEVIAQVRNIDEQAMVRMLSQELAKGHNLVRVRGVEQSGDKRLSRYQFSHNLFQKYLYSLLDPVERAYQHQAIGSALERLHQGHTEAIAVHLARHFQAAGVNEKAIQYLKQAGEAAARVYAHAEAIIHYGQAIHLVEQVTISDQDLSALYTQVGRALELNSSFDQALEIYEELGRLAVQRKSSAMELTSLVARVTILSIPTAVHDAGRARKLG